MWWLLAAIAYFLILKIYFKLFDITFDYLDRAKGLDKAQMEFDKWKQTRS